MLCFFYKEWISLRFFFALSFSNLQTGAAPFDFSLAMFESGYQLDGLDI